MIREGVPAGALASATTHHLDALYRQTRAVVWSPTYCEPAYERLHSEWTMRRAQQRRLRQQTAERAARTEAWNAESADASVVEEVMAKYRRAKPVVQARQSDVDGMSREAVQREMDSSVVTAKGISHGR